MFAQFKSTRKGDHNAYIARSFRNKKGDKTSSVIVERIGLLSEIAEQHPDMDPRESVRQRAAELTRKEKEEERTVSVRLSLARRIRAERKRLYHAEAQWYTNGYDESFTLELASGIFGDRFAEMVFYRHRWTKETYKDSHGKVRDLEEHPIVTYSHIYVLYQRKTRAEQIERAQAKINRGDGCKPKSPNDC